LIWNFDVRKMGWRTSFGTECMHIKDPTRDDTFSVQYITSSQGLFLALAGSPEGPANGQVGQPSLEILMIAIRQGVIT